MDYGSTKVSCALKTDMSEILCIMLSRLNSILGADISSENYTQGLRSLKLTQPIQRDDDDGNVDSEDTVAYEYKPDSNVQSQNYFNIIYRGSVYKFTKGTFIKNELSEAEFRVSGAVSASEQISLAYNQPGVFENVIEPFIETLLFPDDGSKTCTAEISKPRLTINWSYEPHIEISPDIRRISGQLVFEQST